MSGVKGKKKLLRGKKRESRSALGHPESQKREKPEKIRHKTLSSKNKKLGESKGLQTSNCVTQGGVDNENQTAMNH